MATPQEQHAGVFHLDADFHDFDELAEAIAGWDLDWQQLDRGRLEARLQQIHTPSSLLSRVSFSRQFHQRGASPPGFVTFGLLEDGTDEINWCGRGALVRAGDKMVEVPHIVRRNQQLLVCPHEHLPEQHAVGHEPRP